MHRSAFMVRPADLCPQTCNGRLRDRGVTARARFGSIAVVGVAAFIAWPLTAQALDKQGSAHGGQVEGPTSGMGLSGSLMLGSSLYNPSYAARPDNSGRALMRYAAHFDWDLIGRRLSVPLDLNIFSDSQRESLGKLAPTELDIITGLTSTWKAGPGALEGGVRFERDMTVDQAGPSQSYVDARARYVFGLAQSMPRVGHALRGGDVTGWFTLGWFAYNPSYFARPDNTGRALFRYAAHVEISLFDRRLALALDAIFFTDRQAGNVMRPSELDLTPELILRLRDLEIHLAFETDMPVDRGGLVQKFVYVLAVWSFSLLDPPAHGGVASASGEPADSRADGTTFAPPEQGSR